MCMFIKPFSKTYILKSKYFTQMGHSKKLCTSEGAPIEMTMIESNTNRYY